MFGNKLNNDLIFFHTGLEGSLFKCTSGSYINSELIDLIQSNLEIETGKKVSHTEDRRSKSRN